MKSPPGAQRLAPSRSEQVMSETASTSKQQEPATTRISSSSRLTKRLASETKHLIELRSRKLTVCLFLLAAAIASLTPFLSLHLTNRVGLLLFESDLIQLRSSLVTVIVTFVFLLALDATVLLLDYKFARAAQPLLTFQRLLKALVGLLAIASVLSYLALALVVPHVIQIQRAPLATFDCSANTITIENCHQQFAPLNRDLGGGQAFGDDHDDDDSAPSSSSSVIVDTIGQLIVGDLNGNNERLAKRLECLKYNNHNFNDEPGRSSGRPAGVPTRFLLHKCGLVCEPHRQHLHQFNDDLNADQQQQQPPQWRRAQQPQLERNSLVAPYSQPDAALERSPAANSSRQQQRQRAEEEPPGGGLVSLKLCFSGEINGETSNYKRYCIENLTSGSATARSATLTGEPASQAAAAFPSQQADKTLTVSQLNAILSRVRVDELAAGQRQQQDEPVASDYQNVIAGAPATQAAISPRLDQSTHYVNPIVQFESHFKNWPHLARTGASSTTSHNEQQHRPAAHYGNQRAAAAAAGESGWCKYKPVPPFIVNNKPFSDIQCSLEHEYFMSTSHSGEQHNNAAAARTQRAAGDRIYLKKSAQPAELYHSERCNIQCKVDILYQVRRVARGGGGGAGDSAAGSQPNIGKLATSKVYYLPLKSCLIVLAGGDKARTSSYYLITRSLADSSLLLAFILLDVLLLIESLDTKQFPLEANKRRLFSLLLALALAPLLVAALFDLAAAWLPTDEPQTTGAPRRDGYLMSLLNDKLIPFMSDSLAQLYAHLKGDSAASRRPPSGHDTSDNGDTPAAPEHESQSNGPNATGGEREFAARLAQQQQQQQQLVVDNYLVPFLVYALFMFALALNSFKLPLLGLKSPLARAASTEELGLARRPIRGHSPLKQHASSDGQLACAIEKGSSSKSSPSKLGAKSMASSREQQLGEHASARRGRRSSPARSAALFAILTLFMGLQFNMSQLTQSQILLDSFNIQNDLIQQQQQQHAANNPAAHRASERPNKAALWFVLVAANSSGTIFLLLLALLFSTELSVFLADFCPFKPLPAAAASGQQRELDEVDEVKELGAMKFRRYIGIALGAYALRYFVLANMSQMSRARWFLVVLFQAGELLNFPLAWFVLASRAHELLAEDATFERLLKRSALLLAGDEAPPSSSSTRARPLEQSRAARTTWRLVNVHILVQSSLAFVYFPLARFLALFVHSLHASLYFHSDNVHWFIASLYEQGKYAHLNGLGNHSAKQATPPNARSANGTLEQQAAADSLSAPDALFAPLPSERQTYLHASRSFIKYNSLVCLLLAAGFLGAFARARYKRWRRARRRRELERAAEQQRRLAASADCESDLIDQQLSADLRQLHASSRRHSLTAGASLTHLLPAGRELTDGESRAAAGDTERDCKLAAGNDRPRARIHFRYNPGARRDSTSTSTSSIASVAAARTLARNARSRAAAAAAAAAAQAKQLPGRRQLTPSTSTADEVAPTTPTSTPDEGRSPVELRIPIIMEETRESAGESAGESESAESGAGGGESSVNIEQLTQTYSKRVERVRLVGDDENWSLGSGASAAPPGEFGRAAGAASSPAPPPPNAFAGRDSGSEQDDAADRDDRPIDRAPVPTFAARAAAAAGDARRSSSPPQVAHLSERNNKRITFAPTTTFIDQDGGQSERQFGRQSAAANQHAKYTRGGGGGGVVVAQRRQPRLIASPEPSIDEAETSLDQGEGALHFRVNESIGLSRSQRGSSASSADDYDDSIEHRAY